MNGHGISKQVVLAISIAILVVACGGPAGERFEVRLDGKECTVSGPTEVPTGEHTFVLYNVSDQDVQVAVQHYVQGRTFQDMLDMQGDPGEWFAVPSWVRPTFVTEAPTEEADGGKAWIFSLVQDGEYGIALISHASQTAWLCVGFQVVEAPSE
jgi:hypothetical protein